MMAIFVSRLPVGVPRPEVEKFHVGKAAVRSAGGQTEWIMKRSLLIEYKE